jgi:hypothetical protein
MSSTRSTESLTNPSAGKIDQQRKILEELEKRKKQLNQGGTGLVSNNSMNNSNNIPSATTTTASNSPISMTTPSVENQHLLNNNQRAALEVANKSSFGYFIPQDSNFGNLILPVIPRQKE